jgi:hypothetical protein
VDRREDNIKKDAEETMCAGVAKGSIRSGTGTSGGLHEILEIT